MYIKHAGRVYMQSKNALQDAYQRKCQTCVLQKPKSENMYAKDGTKSTSDTVSKSKHHLTTTNNQYVYKENTSRCVYNRETLDSKECAARVCSAPAHIEKMLHRHKITAHKKCKHHARQHDIDSKRTELTCVKQGKYVKKYRKREENTQHVFEDAVLWKEDSKYMIGAYDE
jgi:hypothetical protein